MTVEQMQLLLLKGAVSELPQDAQKTVAEVKAKIEAIAKEAGHLGTVALCLIAGEIACESP